MSETPEAVVVIDDAGLILRFDDSAKSVFGYTAEEVIGKNVRMLMPEPYRSDHDQYIADYLRTGVAHIIGIGRDITATRKDGSDFPAHLSVVEISLSGARRFIGILRDITAQVAADADSSAYRSALDAATANLLELSNEHADAEARYRLLSDNAVDVIAHQRGNEVVWISPSVEAMFGDPPRRWIGRDFTPRIHPDDLDVVAATVQEVARGKSAAARCRVLTVSGGYRWVDARAKPFIDATGTTDGMIFALRVIDKQVAVEQQLAADRERFKSVVENAPSAISVRDLNLRYTLVNTAFCRMFGQQSVEDVIGRTEEEVLPPDVLRRARNCNARLLAGESFVEEETVSPWGKALCIMTQRFPLLDSTGATAEFVSIRTDITHRKEVERKAAEQAKWRERIDVAIGDGRLLVYSQPIVDIATREPVGEELLVRLRVAGSDEVLTPSAFLPQCERYELMPLIDRYMVGRAIDLARAGRRVSVNVTGQTIGDPPAMETIVEALKAAGTDVTRRILVEITESTALASPALAQSFSHSMDALGCRMALDDFGTGYGTFKELRHLDLDSLKIDQSFVHGMLDDPADERAVKTIIVVARMYGLTTVAEGVETEPTLERLAALGVNRAQGYLFGKPGPVARPKSNGDAATLASEQRPPQMSLPVSRYS